VLGLIRQHGWAPLIALVFLGMYFGWLPDPRRTASEKLVGAMTSEMAGLRADVRRASERSVRLMGMMTELCLAMQRHDAKSVGSCTYVYENHQGGGP